MSANFACDRRTVNTLLASLQQSIAHESMQRAQYVYDAAILAALSGLPEGARKMIRIALKIDSTDADAQEIQKIIPEK